MTRLFFDLHRPGDDQCAHTVEEDQNRSIFEHTTYNYYQTPKDALVGFSSDHVNLRFGVGHGVAAPSNIDTESEIKVRPQWTPRGVQQLAVRTYHAVPNLSGGSVKDTVVEEAVKWGSSTFNRATALSGVFIEQQYYPLIPSLEKKVQDPAHIVPPWVWGGESTREASRTLAFQATQGYQRGDVSSSSDRPAPFVRQ